jgi:tyrosinase
MTAQEQQDYMDGVTAMIADGSYGALVVIHSDMTHRMHTMAMYGLVSTLRFLSWHRAYLLQMEATLVAKKANAFIPWWDWTTPGIPSWLVGFKPTVNIPSGPWAGNVVNTRNNLTAAVSDQARLDVLTQTLTDYTDFTRQLEVNPHNKGHVMLGKPMEFPPTAPCDPIFWMHHAEVDRIWALWQAKNPGKGPILTGKDAEMDPWNSMTVSNLASISANHYSYV